jgi:hypothetical protein
LEWLAAAAVAQQLEELVWLVLLVDQAAQDFIQAAEAAAAAVEITHHLAERAAEAAGLREQVQTAVRQLAALARVQLAQAERLVAAEELAAAAARRRQLFPQ